MKMKLIQRASRLLPCLLLTAGLASAFAGCKKKDMSMKMNEPRNIHGVANFGRTFGDLNQKQLNVAQAIGISPIASREEANPNRIIVTSVLRTEKDVKRLRRRNTNASSNSTHAYGTTFDISWKRFQKVEDEDGRPMQDVGADTLKLVLAEVLRDLRRADRCYVKYEIKQACFHITTRK